MIRLKHRARIGPFLAGLLVASLALAQTKPPIPASGASGTGNCPSNQFESADNSTGPTCQSFNGTAVKSLTANGDAGVTGSATVSKNLTVSGDAGVTGNEQVTGSELVDGGVFVTAQGGTAVSIQQNDMLSLKGDSLGTAATIGLKFLSASSSLNLIVNSGAGFLVTIPPVTYFCFNAATCTVYMINNTGTNLQVSAGTFDWNNTLWKAGAMSVDNAGTVQLNGASPSVATATVQGSTAVCVISAKDNTTDSASKWSVASTTLTITGPNGSTGHMSYHCF